MTTDNAPLRIAIGGISHETNTYVPSPTTLDQFRVVRGDELLAFSGTGIGSGGMIERAREIGAEVIPTLLASANPWGIIAEDAYETLKAELLDGLGAAMPLDVVGLDIHGAGVTETTDDLEGDLCRAVRGVVGDDTVIVTIHDLHGNITQDQADVVDGIFCCHNYPHDDYRERGHEAIDFAVKVKAGELQPVIHVERLPLLMPTTTTFFGVGAEINAHLAGLEQLPGVIDVTLQHGFPYCDVPIVGSTIICITDGDRDLARQVAREAATFVWSQRDRLHVEYPMPDEAIEQALAVEGRPVVINETSDNPGGGTPCDGTHLLRAMLEADLDDAVFIGIRDEEVVRAATDAGVGKTITVELGGKTDELHGEPVEVTGYVKALTDGAVKLECKLGRGVEFHYGHTALLIAGGLEIIVISERQQGLDWTLPRLHGIDVRDRRIVALKSSNHFRSGFQDLAAAIITTDPPGFTTMRLDVFDKVRSPRPIAPLDDDAVYPSNAVSSSAAGDPALERGCSRRPPPRP
ncbi:MAG TPA: M81 family metallopeptidase [Nitriliruptorales bacterium]